MASPANAALAVLEAALENFLQAAANEAWRGTDAESVDLVERTHRLRGRFQYAHLVSVAEMDERGVAEVSGAKSTKAWLRHRLRETPAAAGATAKLAVACTRKGPHAPVGAALGSGDLNWDQFRVTVKALAKAPTQDLHRAPRVRPRPPAAEGRRTQRRRPAQGRASAAGRSRPGRETQGRRGRRTRPQRPVPRPPRRHRLDHLARPRRQHRRRQDRHRRPGRREATAQRWDRPPDPRTTSGRRDGAHLRQRTAPRETPHQPRTSPPDPHHRHRRGTQGPRRRGQGSTRHRWGLDPHHPAALPLRRRHHPDPPRPARQTTLGRADHPDLAPGDLAAIVARDTGCTFPGCDVPAHDCVAHHRKHWTRDHGETSEENGVLLCDRHHFDVHHHGWTVRLDRYGIPEFIPPPWVDSTGEPRTNDYWKLQQGACWFRSPSRNPNPGVDVPSLRAAT